MPAPTAPVIASFSTDSGVAGDHITNDNTLTLTGSALASSTVSIYDGATLLGTTSANASGAWSYTSRALTDGGHSFTATATDVAGNVSTHSSALGLTIDTVAPATPVASVAIGTGSFAYLSGTAEAGSTVSILDPFSMATVGTAVTNAQGSWTFMKFGLPSDSFVLSRPDAAVLTATDAAGNSSLGPTAQSLQNATVPTFRVDFGPAPAAFDFGPGAVADHGPAIAAALEPVRVFETPSMELVHLYNHPPLV